MKAFRVHFLTAICCCALWSCGGSSSGETSSSSSSSSSSQSNSSQSNSSQLNSSSSSSSNQNDANAILLRGKEIYQEECEACHTADGSDLGLAPAINNWEGSANELVAVIEATMPKADVNACDLECSQYTAAYILAGFSEFGELHPDIVITESETPIINDSIAALPDTTQNLVYSERESSITPLRIEAEHFDNGGENISYFDFTPGSANADLRPETDVDFELTGDVDGEYNVGWIDPDEWLNYSFENSEAQALRITWRVASVHDSSSFNWYINDNLQGEVVFTNTGGWQAYVDIQSDSAKLESGWHTLKIEANSGFNINYLSIERSPQQPLDASQLAGIPAPIPLHRISNTQYQRTIAAIFNVDVAASALIADSVAENFDRVANILSMNEIRLEQYYDAAEGLLDQFFVTTSGINTLMQCELSQATFSSCGETIARYWIEKLWRIDATNEEINTAINFLNQRMQEGSTGQEAVKTWLHAMLVSAKFLHHIESSNGPSNTIQAISAHDLANRLAFFLWCSPPDETLKNLAESGEILQNTVIQQQIDRMINDPKAACLVESFAHRWLYLNAVAEKASKAIPDNNPGWSPELADSMIAETQNFILYLIRENISVNDILGAQYTFVDDALADYYQIPRSNQVDNRVDLSTSERQGILTQGAILLLTGSDRGTAFIKRGVYALEHILCDGPPLPPANIDQSQSTENDTCQGCHKYINPIGRGLDHFDSLGFYRTTDSEGNTILAMGNFFEGPSFDGASEMIDVLKNDERVAACVMEKFYGYAHARIPDSDDDHAFIEDLLEQWRTSGLGMSDLLKIIATSPSFTHYYSAANE